MSENNMNKEIKKPSFSLKCLGELFKENGKSSRKRSFPLLPPLTWDSVLKKYIEKKEKEHYDRKRKN